MSDLPSGLVTVGTAAGGYNPVYYALIGFPTRMFEGAGVDYAMRALSALVCAVAVAISAGALGVARAGVWARFGFLASLTPVLVYSSVVPAPNALEMVAGLCVWTTMLGAMREETPPGVRRALIGVATAAAVVLAVSRALGPVWLALIAVTLLLFVGWGRARDAVSESPRAYAWATAVVAVAVAMAAWWVVSAGPTQNSEELGPDPSSDSAGTSAWIRRVVAWTLQMVGAFPYRDQPAPLGVYAIYFERIRLPVRCCVPRGHQTTATPRGRHMLRFNRAADCVHAGHCHHAGRLLAG